MPIRSQKNHNRNARNLLLSYIYDRDRIYPFREFHGNTRNTRKYSWTRFSPLQQGRLDYFLMTNNLNSFLRNCDIDVSYKSDHSIIVLDLQFSSN